VKVFEPREIVPVLSEAGDEKDATDGYCPTCSTKSEMRFWQMYLPYY
jgi:hypothetical protein